jgi:hypothetical protein
MAVKTIDIGFLRSHKNPVKYAIRNACLIANDKTLSKAIHCFSLVLLPVVEFSLRMYRSITMIFMELD